MNQDELNHDIIAARKATNEVLASRGWNLLAFFGTQGARGFADAWAHEQATARKNDFTWPDLCDGLTFTINADVLEISVSGEAAQLTEIDLEWGLV